MQLVYVMPSTSGRAATYPRRADKLKFFHELKDLRDKLKAQRDAGGSAVTATATEETVKQNETVPCSPSIDLLQQREE